MSDRRSVAGLFAIIVWKSLWGETEGCGARAVCWRGVRVEGRASLDPILPSSLMSLLRVEGTAVAAAAAWILLRTEGEDVSLANLSSANRAVYGCLKPAEALVVVEGSGRLRFAFLGDATSGEGGPNGVREGALSYTFPGEMLPFGRG